MSAPSLSALALLSDVNSTTFYCPACEKPYAPSPPHHPPVLLSPCGHSLCAACFAALPSPARCVVCNDDVDGHKSNTFLAELATDVLGGVGADALTGAASASCADCVATGDSGDDDGFPVVSMCETCDKLLCDVHVVAHTRRKVPHTVITPADNSVLSSPPPAKRAKAASSDAHCAQHVSVSCDLYCMTHSVKLCGLCVKEAHAGSGCDVVSALEATRRVHQQSAIHARRASTAASTTYKGAIERVQGALEGLKAQHAACRHRVNVDMDAILAGVEAHRVAVLGQLDDVYKQRVKSLEATLDRLVVSAGQLEACVVMAAKQAGQNHSDVVRAVEWESLCAGMSALADAYVGVDVPLNMSVSVDVGDVLSAVSVCTTVVTRDVCVDECEVTGPGMFGFAIEAHASNAGSDIGNEYDSDCDAKTYNTFLVKCVDADGSPLAYVCADDVRVSVRHVDVAGSGSNGLADEYASGGCSAIARCVVSVTSALQSNDANGDEGSHVGGVHAAGSGTFCVRYTMPCCSCSGGDRRGTSPSASCGDYSGTSDTWHPCEVDISVTVCGKLLLGFPIRVSSIYTPFRALALDCTVERDPVRFVNVLDVLEKCVGVAEVQRMGFDVLANNIVCLPSSARGISTLYARIAKHALVVLEYHADNADVLRACLWLLDEMTWCNSEHCQSMCKQLGHVTLSGVGGAFDVLVQCGHRHAGNDERLVVHLCAVLFQCTFGSKPGCLALFAVAGAVSLVLALWRRHHAGNADIVASCCGVLVNLSHFLQSPFVPRLPLSDVIELALGALEQLSGNSQNLRAPLQLLINIALYCGNNVFIQALATEVRPAEKAAMYMELYSDDVLLQATCCHLVECFVAAGAPIADNDATLQRFVRCVLAAVDALLGSSELNLRACCVLHGLATRSPLVVAQLREAGCVALVERARERHGVEKLAGWDRKLLDILA